LALRLVDGVLDLHEVELRDHVERWHCGTPAESRLRSVIYQLTRDLAPMPFRCITLFITTLFVGLTMLAPPAAAKKAAKLSPAKIKQIKKSRKSFENCRKDALAQLKNGAVSKKKFEVLLNTCKENFPGASLYISCKKAAIKTAESQNLAPDQAIEQCKRYL